MKKSTKILSYSIAIIILIATTVISSFTLTHGKYEYTVISETQKTACISEYNGWETDVVIPSTINGYTITKIGERAFENGYMSSVTIPTSITLVEEYAFYSCDSLESMYYSGTADNWTKISFGNPEANPMYYATNEYFNNKLITDVVLSEGLTSIGTSAFANCNMTSITIPKSVKSIGEYAFYELIDLTDMYYTGNGNDWAKISFGGYNSNPMLFAENAYFNNEVLTEVIISSDISKISDYAFEGCKTLRNVIISHGILSIGEYAFNQCEQLRSITIPQSVTSIGDFAFNGCKYLRNISLPSNLTELGVAVFGNCESLDSIVIPDRITEIKSGTFSNCKNLHSIQIPGGVTSIKYNAFYACNNLQDFNFMGTADEWVNISFADYNANPMSYARYFYFNNQLVTDIVLTEGITTIKPYAFWDCYTLLSIIIPDSVTSIGAYAFGHCENLQSVKISKNIKTIENYTFYFCQSLQQIVIPEGVRTIGKNAFDVCTNLKYITIPNSVRFIENTAFNYCDDLWHVLYTGTESEWNSISIANYNNCITNAVRHYNTAGNEVTFTTEIEATCNNSGLLITKCSICNDENDDVVEMLDHKYDKLNIVKEPDCTTDGLKTKTCSVCQYQKNYSIPAIGHDYGEWSVISNETCTEKGSMERTCYTCNYIEVKEIPATGHSYDGWTDGKASTCTEPGTVLSTCMVCGYVRTERLPLLSHAFKSGICTTCGLQLPQSSHPYSNNTDTTWVIYQPAAAEIYIRFSSNTKTEDENDFIYIYDGNDTLIDKFSGTELAGYGIVVESDTIKIRLTSNDNTTFYGFTVEDLVITEVACPHEKTEIRNGLGATCEEDGYTSSVYCFDCNKIAIKSQIIPATGHIYDNWTVITDATCTSVGEITSFCTVCGKTTSEETPMIPHSYENDVCNMCGLEFVFESLHPYASNTEETWIISKPGARKIKVTFSDETATENKYDNIYIYDADDNEIGKYSGTQLAGKTVTIESDVVKIKLKTDYSLNYYGFKVVKIETIYQCDHNNTQIIDNYEATCEQHGSMGNIYCLDCKEILEYGEKIPATGHSYTSEVTKVPTHTETGVRTYTCNCGHSYIETIEVTSDHTYVESITKEATCTSVGEITFVCICGSSYTEEISVLGHDYATDYTVDTEATCTTDGSKSQHCSRCDSTTNVTTIPAKGHNYSEWTLANEGTCTNPGQDMRSCLFCGDVQYRENSSKEHDYVSELIIVVEPTCTEQGYSTYVCAACDYRYVDDYTAPYGHNYIDGVCERCGEKDPSVSDEPEYNYTFKIQKPSMTTIRHKDGIKLHTNIEGTAPAGSYVVWTANNNKFKTEEINNGNSLKIVSDSNGTTTFTATLYSADGEVIATDTIEMKSKAGFFDKIGSFFRSLFGSTKIHEN